MLYGTVKPEARVGEYGHVVECVHADTQTIAVLDSYTFFRPGAHRGWRKGESDEAVDLALLKEMADKMGFRLVRKAPVKA